METTARPSETPRELTDVDTADATPDASAKRKRQPRNSACQSCAVRMCRWLSLGMRRLISDFLQGLKMKCIASTVVGICERLVRRPNHLPECVLRKSSDPDLETLSFHLFMILPYSICREC